MSDVLEQAVQTAEAPASTVAEAFEAETPAAPTVDSLVQPSAITAVTEDKDLASMIAKDPAADLTEEDKKAIEAYKNEIDINDTQMVLQYGAAAQKKVADFSESTLNNVKTKDLGEVGDMLSSVVTELKSFDVSEEKHGIFGFFKKTANQVTAVKARYDKAENNIDAVVKAMQEHQVTLLKDVAMLDKMYDANLSYFKDLTLYILAGKEKLKEAKEIELPKLLAKAEASQLPEDTQAAKDFASKIDRFEKKIYDLELTRNISMQMAPQIRLIQNNDTIMSEKIQSTLVNTIPLWKSQMVIAIGVNHASEAAKAEREVTDMTNELLKKNAEALKMATIESAKESERGIVDVETLTHTNQMLIDTLDEVMKIQTEGRAKRAEAEVELKRIETQMRDKLVEVSKATIDSQQQ